MAQLPVIITYFTWWL